MDTSETYIKMCEKTIELQRKWQPAIGDYIGGEWYVDKEDTIGLCCQGIVVKLNPEGHKDCVSTGGDIFWAIQTHYWLPRQDQLQEMVWSHIAGTYNLLATKLFAFTDYWEEKGIPTQFTSMEQLWLAFLMKKKHNKIWTGEDWIKEKVNG